MSEPKVLFKIHTWINDKLIVFSRPKIATRVLDTYFNYNNCFDFHLELSSKGISIVDVHHQNNNPELSDAKKAKEILSNFLIGKEKRDVLILYREPYKRFVSGVYQEFLSSVTSVENFYFMVKDIDERLELYELLVKIRNATFSFEHDDISEKLHTSLYKLIKEYVNYMIQTNINQEHTNNHLQIYNLLFSMCKLNESKIKIVNTEINDIEPFLKPYFIDNKWKKGEGPPFNFARDSKDKSILREQFSNKELKRMVFNVLSQTNMLPSLNSINNLIGEYLKPEYAAYYYLQSHIRNIDNLKTLPTKKTQTTKKI